MIQEHLGLGHHLIALILAFCALPWINGIPLSFATTFVNRPLKDVINESYFIVRGKPADNYTAWGKTEQKALFTYTELEVLEVIKGDIADTNITLRQPGGVKDGIEMAVPGSARFTRGEEVVVLLHQKNNDDGSYDVPGLATGKYIVTTDAQGHKMLSNSLGGESVYDPQKLPGTLSYNASMPLDVFRKAVHGAEVAESNQNQFVPSQKQNHAADDHGHASVVKKQTVPAAVGQNTVQQSELQAEDADSNKKMQLWIPLSFIAALLVGVFIFFKLSHHKGGDK